VFVAHKIRNRASKTFEAVFKIPAKTRWCLTGTPIQNCLDDYGALLAFVGVSPFMAKDAFDKWIARPVRSKDLDSLPTLRRLVAATCLRRTKATHASALGLSRKTEQVELVEMSSNDRQLYEFFKRRSYLVADLKNTANGLKRGSVRSANTLVLIGILRLICNHGQALLSESALKAWKSQDASLVSWEMLKSGVRRCDSCDLQIEEFNISESMVEVFACEHVVCESCASKIHSSDNSSSCPKCRKPPSKAPSPALSKVEPESSSKERYPPSAKVNALLRNLAKTHSAARFGPGTKSQKRLVLFHVSHSNLSDSRVA
jgi:SWI/SNF-related matrix-associated actin-dependent regulator of chromatin subfamily A3